MGTQSTDQLGSFSNSQLDAEAIGLRLRQVRGNFTQAAFAEQLGLERKTVNRYESGERAPDALALLRLMQQFGVDPGWLLTGEGHAPSHSDDEQELLTLFKSATLAAKMAAVGALKGALSAEVPHRSRVSVKASGGYAAGRDMNINNPGEGRANEQKNKGGKSARVRGGA